MTLERVSIEEVAQLWVRGGASVCEWVVTRKRGHGRDG
jgi:hypothetical protein